MTDFNGDIDIDNGTAIVTFEAGPDPDLETLLNAALQPVPLKAQGADVQTIRVQVTLNAEPVAVFSVGYDAAHEYRHDHDAEAFMKAWDVLRWDPEFLTGVAAVRGW